MPEHAGWFFDSVTLSNFALAGGLQILIDRYRKRGFVTTQVVDELTRGVAAGYAPLSDGLDLVDRGILSATSQGSMHGEIGHTQFLPKSVLLYANGSLDDADTALVATANFLKANGWRPQTGYQPGEPNFTAIQAWNAASVYQRAIAVLGRQIDGNGASTLD